MRKDMQDPIRYYYNCGHFDQTATIVAGGEFGIAKAYKVNADCAACDMKNSKSTGFRVVGIYSPFLNECEKILKENS